jgi:hypothetical protein
MIVSFVKWVCIILKLKRERGGWRNRENFTKLGVSHCRGREDKKEDRKSRGKERRYFRRRNGGKTKINRGWTSGSGRKKLKNRGKTKNLVACDPDMPLNFVACLAYTSQISGVSV